MTELEHPQTVALLDSRYQLLECVGAGGTAEVYRAEDMLLGRTVAIKLMRPDAEVLASPLRIHREVSALASLNHHSLVTLLDACIDAGDSRYLVMEYVEGPTLAHVLRDGPMPAAHVSHLAAELAAALQVVHQANLVHRDIKPSNILLAASSMPGVCFDVKLADFGLVQLTDAPAVTTPGLVLGTGAYLAPEQVRGERSGPAADIYALGLVLLEALTGERAFGHASGIGAMMARLLEPAAIPDDLDPRWSQLIRSMTADEPDARPTAREVAEAVADLPVAGPAAAAAGLALVPDASDTGRPDASPTEAGVAMPPRPAMPRVRRWHAPRPVVALASMAAAAVASLFIVGAGFAMQASGGLVADPGLLTQVAPSAVPSGLPTAWTSDNTAVPAAAVDTGTNSGGASADTPVSAVASNGNGQTQKHDGQSAQQGPGSRSGQGAAHPPQGGRKAGK